MEKSKVAPNDEQAIPRWIRAGAIGGRIGETRWKWFIIGVVLAGISLVHGHYGTCVIKKNGESRLP